jgi:hypothetical protein
MQSSLCRLRADFKWHARTPEQHSRSNKFDCPRELASCGKRDDAVRLNVVWVDLISSLPVHVDQRLLVQRTLHDAADSTWLRLHRAQIENL